MHPADVCVIEIYRCAVPSKVKPEPPEEVLARYCMSESLGVPVERHDTGVEPGMYDFKFVSPDGQLAAGEMTTIADDVAMEWDALSARSRRVEGSQWAWMVWPRGSRFSVKELMQHMPEITRVAESESCTSVNLLRYGEHRDEPAFVWLRDSGVEITGLTETSKPGVVYLMHDAIVDMVHERLDPMLDWLEMELEDTRYDAKFDKLERSGRPDHHLFLRVHISGIPMSIGYHLSTSLDLPSRPPTFPTRVLSGLWLAPEFSKSVLYWTRHTAWQRHLHPSAQEENHGGG